MTSSSYAKFKNDRGVPEIRIGTKVFECAGASAPHDHPHIFLDMGPADRIICPYCATLFRYDDRLDPDEADPQDCLF
ncbi:MAG: zinc-finger domain-containing protein [Rhodospirillales bacterium]|nr:zinc-finger domain-containing protein [Rhodospirillales bacterium]